MSDFDTKKMDNSAEYAFAYTTILNKNDNGEHPTNTDVFTVRISGIKEAMETDNQSPVSVNVGGHSMEGLFKVDDDVALNEDAVMEITSDVSLSVLKNMFPYVGATFFASDADNEKYKTQPFIEANDEVRYAVKEYLSGIVENLRESDFGDIDSNDLVKEMLTGDGAPDLESRSFMTISRVSSV